MTKPVLLVDVDGVLNVFEHPMPMLEKEFEAWSSDKHTSYKISVPVGVTQRLHDLTERYDPVWCTTWEHDANAVLLREFEFTEPWPVIEWTRSSGWTWKLQDVRDWVALHATNRPVAWVDDDLGHDAFEWAEDRGRTLLVRTRPSLGLSRQAFRTLRDWEPAQAGESERYEEE